LQGHDTEEKILKDKCVKSNEVSNKNKQKIFVSVLKLKTFTILGRTKRFSIMIIFMTFYLFPVFPDASKNKKKYDKVEEKFN